VGDRFIREMTQALAQRQSETIVVPLRKHWSLWIPSRDYTVPAPFSLVVSCLFWGPGVRLALALALGRALGKISGKVYTPPDLAFGRALGKTSGKVYTPPDLAFGRALGRTSGKVYAPPRRASGSAFGRALGAMSTLAHHAGNVGGAARVEEVRRWAKLATDYSLMAMMTMGIALRRQRLAQATPSDGDDDDGDSSVHRASCSPK